MIRYIDAVRELVGGSIGGLSDGPLNQLKFCSGQTPPTEEAIQAKLTELQSEYDATQYQRDRQQEYPTIEECIHAILDDDLETLQARRTAVKTKYPKPE